MSTEKKEKPQTDDTCVKCEEMLNLAKYKAAELENYIKRQKDAVSHAFNDGRTQVIANVVPVLDDLQMFDDDGVRIVAKKFASILQRLGVEEIDCKKGDKFDPYKHNCVTKETDSNVISDVFQKGYIFAGKVLRPAMVKI